MALGIIYLDDSDLALETVKDGLEPLGIDVTTHRDPFTIGAAVAESNPALLLLDAHLPALDGRAICRLVRQQRPDLPIALFSAQEAESLRAMSADCGASGYIVKSDRFEQIAADIRRMALPATGARP
jgi:DNA-binding response OmpR family regulator